MSDEHPNPGALVGTTLSGRYRIDRLLGEGGMGAVYEAEHTHMRKRLAVKVLHPEMCRMPEVVARFEREAMAASHIDHPNIAAATDFGKTEDGSFFLVLEYVEGVSLRDRINRFAPMPVGRALHIARQIAGALQRAHAMGIVHRDLKPENVMLVDRDGDPDFVKVLDFGIAKVPVGELAGVSVSGQPVLTQLGMVYGTPEYMAPEQAAGQEVEARADLYSLGIILYEMLCGIRPFDHESKVALMGMHVTAPVPRMAEMAPKVSVPAQIESWIHKLLEKEAGRRPTDVQFVELLDDLMIDYPAPGAGGGTGAGAGRSNPNARNVSSPTTPRPDKPAAHRPMWTPPRSNPSAARITTGAPLPVIASVPTRRQPKVITVGAIALAIGAFATGIVLMATHKPVGGKVDPGADGGTEKAAASAGPAGLTTDGTGDKPAGVTSGSSAGTDDGSIDKAIAQGGAALNRGEDDAVVKTLAPLAEKYPDRSDLHRLLTHAYAALGTMKPAMHEAETWLKIDPSAGRDSQLIEDVRKAAIGKDREASSQGLALLETQMGPSGLDVLYDIAYGNNAAKYSSAAVSQAKNALRAPEVHNRASPALQVALDLRPSAPVACDDRLAHVKAAYSVGDARALPLLKNLSWTTGCGFANSHDCYPCLRRDGVLSKTIAAIEERGRSR